MSPLRIVVLESDSQQRQLLLAQLDALGSNCLLQSQNAEEALKLCRATPVDIVMCHLTGEIDTCRALMRKLADFPYPPALAFYGCDAEVGYLETSCIHFGLCYLGFISVPFEKIRLQRMLEQRRAYGKGVSS